jgi:hypothetical protein
LFHEFLVCHRLDRLYGSGPVGTLGVFGFMRRRIRALERSRDEMSERREAVVDMMNRIGLCLNTTLDLDGALVMIAEYLVETTQAESGAIFVLNTAGKALRARALAGPFPPILRPSGDGSLRDIREYRIAVGEGIIGFVAKTGESLLIADALSDARVTQPPEGHPPLRSLLAVPLQLQHKTLGVCVLLNRRGTRPFDDQDLRLTRQLAGQAALTVNVARLYEQEGEQRRLGHELRMAHEFQKMLLPRECPLVEGLQIATYGAPALELGGGFYYDFLWVEKAPVSRRDHRRRCRARASRERGHGDLAQRVALRRAGNPFAARRFAPDQPMPAGGIPSPGCFMTMTSALFDVGASACGSSGRDIEPLIVWNEAEPERVFCNRAAWPWVWWARKSVRFWKSAKSPCAPAIRWCFTPTGSSKRSMPPEPSMARRVSTSAWAGCVTPRPMNRFVPSSKTSVPLPAVSPKTTIRH